MVMGYITYAVMSAIYVAGQLIDTQVGFGIANVMDPISNIQIPLTSNFYYIFIILVFLLLNGHHMLVRALFQSFEAIPVGQFAVTGEFLTLTISVITTMFLVAIKISAPIIAAIFITDIVLGVLSKTMPEMNVFALGMPLKIIIGLAVIMVTFVYANGLTEVVTDLMNEYMIRFLSTMGS
jgi:flagellar biosynthetic protein FliR